MLFPLGSLTRGKRSAPILAPHPIAVIVAVVVVVVVLIVLIYNIPFKWKAVKPFLCRCCP